MKNSSDTILAASGGGIAGSRWVKLEPMGGEPPGFQDCIIQAIRTHAQRYRASACSRPPPARGEPMKTFAYSFTEVATTCLDDDATPWMPLSSKQPDIEIK